MEYHLQSIYREAIKFASAKHSEKSQKIPGTNLPYEVHIANVAMEVLIAGFRTPGFNLEFAVQVALLHDTLEDTDTSFTELEERFGIEVAKAVSALSKKPQLPKEEQMHHSLTLIKAQPLEVWAVKLADRITNLQPSPEHWDKKKRLNYLNEAKLIYDELSRGNEYLADRLKVQIEKYREFT